MVYSMSLKLLRKLDKCSEMKQWPFTLQNESGHVALLYYLCMKICFFKTHMSQ